MNHLVHIDYAQHPDLPSVESFLPEQELRMVENLRITCDQHPQNQEKLQQQVTEKTGEASPEHENAARWLVQLFTLSSLNKRVFSAGQVRVLTLHRCVVTENTFLAMFNPQHFDCLCNSLEQLSILFPIIIDRPTYPPGQDLRPDSCTYFPVFFCLT